MTIVFWVCFLVFGFFCVFLALNGSPSNGRIVNQCVYRIEFLSVKGFAALVEVVSRFHDVSFLCVANHHHSTLAFLFFFLSP